MRLDHCVHKISYTRLEINYKAISHNKNNYLNTCIVEKSLNDFYIIILLGSFDTNQI